MKEFIRVFCPVTHGDCILTKDFIKLTDQEGWQVEKARYDPDDARVLFILSREANNEQLPETIE